MVATLCVPSSAVTRTRVFAELAATPTPPLIRHAADHELEVLVVVDAGTNVGVVVDEFFFGYLAVNLSSYFEGLEGSRNTTVWSWSQRHGVLDAVLLHHLVGVEDAALVLVQAIENHVHKTEAIIIDGATDRCQKLFEVDTAIVVLVELSEDGEEPSLLGSLVLIHGLLELALAQLAVTIVIFS